MKLFSSKVTLFKKAEGESAPTFDALSATVNAADAPDMEPDDFSEKEQAPQNTQMSAPDTSPNTDVIQQLKVKLISVLGEESDAVIKDDKKLEKQTNDITATE